MSIVKRNMRILLGKINENSLKKKNKIQNVKINQKIQFSVKNRVIFLKVPPSLDLPI